MRVPVQRRWDRCGAVEIGLQAPRGDGRPGRSRSIMRAAWDVRSVIEARNSSRRRAWRRNHASALGRWSGRHRRAGRDSRPGPRPDVQRGTPRAGRHPWAPSGQQKKHVLQPLRASLSLWNTGIWKHDGLCEVGRSGCRGRARARSEDVRRPAEREPSKTTCG
jgi:hypothetical protein